MSQAENENESAGIDSFLDVISNFVGILIILVMVVGQRAHDFPFGGKVDKKAEELAAARVEADALDGDVRRIASETQTVQAELAVRATERGQIGTLVAAIEQELAQRRAALDGKCATATTPSTTLRWRGPSSIGWRPRRTRRKKCRRPRP